MVRDECPNIMQVSLVKGFVSPLRHSLLLRVDRLRCILEGPIEENDENLKGFESCFSWQLGEVKRIATLLKYCGFFVDGKEYPLMWEL